MNTFALVLSVINTVVLVYVWAKLEVTITELNRAFKVIRGNFKDMERSFR